MCRGDCGTIRNHTDQSRRFLGMAMIGKNKPKNTSHRPKFPSRRLERNFTEPNGALRDAPGPSRHLPWVATDKKKFGKTLNMGPQDPLWRSFHAGRHPDRSGTEATESSVRRPGWFRCGLETSAPSKGGEGAGGCAGCAARARWKALDIPSGRRRRRARAISAALSRVGAPRRARLLEREPLPGGVPSANLMPRRPLVGTGFFFLFFGLFLAPTSRSALADAF